MVVSSIMLYYLQKFYVLTNIEYPFYSLNLSQWPTWCTNFLLNLLQSSTCFEQYLAHPQEVELYFNAASGIVTLSKWLSGAQVEKELRSFSTFAPDGHLLRVTIPDAALKYNSTSWGWARYCSKHLEDCNKFNKKSVHQVGHWLRLY